VTLAYHPTKLSTSTKQRRTNQVNTIWLNKQFIKFIT